MRKTKIFIRRAKRNIKKFIKQHKKLLVPAAVIFAAFLLLFILLPNAKNFSGAFSKVKDEGTETSTEETETKNEDTITSLEERGFFGISGKADYPWLYGSGNVPMEDVYEYLIEAEGSVYSDMNRAEKKQWLADMYADLGWEEEPDTVTKKEILEIGRLCGFNNDEISIIFSELTKDLP